MQALLKMNENKTPVDKLQMISPNRNSASDDVIDNALARELTAADQGDQKLNFHISNNYQEKGYHRFAAEPIKLLFYK